MHKKNSKLQMDLKNKILYCGEDIFASPNMQKNRSISHHRDVSIFHHCLKVAYLSMKISHFLHLPVDERSLIRGALLHDYYLYDWHEGESWHRLHGFRHPYFSLQNAQAEFELNPIEENIIKRHMFPLTPIPPRYLESIVVCIADKMCTITDVIQ